MTTKNVWQDVVNAAVRAEFDSSKEDILGMIDGNTLFTEYEPDTPNEQVSGVAGPGYGTLTVEGQEYGENEMYREYPVSATLRKYSSKLSWTEEDLHWFSKANQQKRVNKIGEISSNALRPLVGNVNRDIAKLIYLSFGTTFFTGGDAVSLVNAAHPIRATGSTQSNTATAAFAASSLRTAIDAMNRFQGQNGVQLGKVRRFALVGGIEQEASFQQVLDSMYGPGNANLGLQTSSRAQFSARGVQASYIILPEIPSTYSAYWWVIDLDRAVNRLFLGWGWKPRVASETIPGNGTFEMDASTLVAPFAMGWQFIYGSNGTK